MRDSVMQDRRDQGELSLTRQGALDFAARLIAHRHWMGRGDGIVRPYRAAPWWFQALGYVRAGTRLCMRDIYGLIALVGLLMLPAFSAVVIGSQPGPLAPWVSTGLTWVTIVVGNIALVLAMEALDDGRRLVPTELVLTALRWLPRYLWTNGMTTVLFWGIFTPLQTLLAVWLTRWSWPAFAPLALLLLPMLFWHVRLVFATYAAIVDDQPGVRAVSISLGIAQGRWAMVAMAFAGSILIEAPVAGPLYLLIHQVANPAVAFACTWLLVMLMRPLMIAVLHEIYEDFRPAALAQY